MIDLANMSIMKLSNHKQGKQEHMKHLEGKLKLVNERLAKK
jgi:hypothetical protein